MERLNSWEKGRTLIILLRTQTKQTLIFRIRTQPLHVHFAQKET